MQPTRKPEADRFPPQIRRQISILRWTGVIIWIGWVLIAIPLYWAFSTFPRTPEFMQFFTATVALLSFGVVWFIYTVYRIGAIAEGYDNDEEA